MDKTTHEMRAAHWLEVINACQQRPAGVSAQKWLEDNGIQRKTYYYWLRKFRTKAYEQQKQSTIALTESREISFAEMPYPLQSCGTPAVNNTSVNLQDNVKPIAVIQHAGTTIAITGNISAEMLSLILKETLHA